MALILSPNLCLIFFRDPERKFTPRRLKRVLGDKLSKTGGDPPFSFRWKERPILYLAVKRGEFVAALGRRLMGRKRKYLPLIADCDTQIEITFDNLEEVLDDANTLIDAQHLLQSDTGGLLYRSWNGLFSGPDE
jgi:hypothetical protein